MQTKLSTLEDVPQGLRKASQLLGEAIKLLKDKHDYQPILARQSAEQVENKVVEAQNVLAETLDVVPVEATLQQDDRDKTAIVLNILHAKLKTKTQSVLAIVKGILLIPPPFVGVDVDKNGDVNMNELERLVGQNAANSKDVQKFQQDASAFVDQAKESLEEVSLENPENAVRVARENVFKAVVYLTEMVKGLNSLEDAQRWALKNTAAMLELLSKYLKELNLELEHVEVEALTPKDLEYWVDVLKLVKNVLSASDSDFTEKEVDRIEVILKGAKETAAVAEEPAVPVQTTAMVMETQTTAVAEEKEPAVHEMTAVAEEATVQTTAVQPTAADPDPRDATTKWIYGDTEALDLAAGKVVTTPHVTRTGSRSSEVS